MSYFELTGSHYAEKIKVALKACGSKAFVAHLERDKFSGNFHKHIDKKIKKCERFILIITQKALTRAEVIREVKKAFPNGSTKKHDFWIFREDKDTIERTNKDFETKTKIKLEKRNQHDFRHDSELASKVISLFENRESLENISIKTNQNTNSLISIYDSFAHFSTRIVHDFENYDENKRYNKKPVIEQLASTDLFRYFVPQTIFHEVRVRLLKKGKNRYDYFIKEEQGLKFLLDWSRSESKLFILLGDYGAGKTSLSLQLTYQLAKNYLSNSDWRIPVFISLKDYCPEKQNIFDFVAGSIKKQYKIIIDSVAFINLLQEGKFLLTLDGFDEMTTKNNKNTTVRNFKAILQLMVGNSKVLLTSRTHYFRSHDEMENLFEIAGMNLQKDDCQVADIRPFKPDQILEFLKKRSAGEWQQQVQTINTVYNLADLASRPLLLEMITKTLGQLLDNYSNVDASLLYKQYTDFWIEHDDWRSIMKPEGKRQFMEELAINILESNKSSIHFSELMQPIRRHFKKSSEFSNQSDAYYYDATTCSFLNRDSSGNYSFIHKSFMEFFVAEKYASEILDEQIKYYGQDIPSKEILEFLIMILKRRIREDARFQNKDTMAELYFVLEKLVFETRNADTVNKFTGSIAITILKQLTASMQNKDLSKCRLEQSDINHMSLAGCNLRSINFTDSDLRNCDFSNARLEKANLSECKLHNVKVDNASFENCNLRYVKMPLINCKRLTCEGAIFDNADLSGCNFSYARLENCSIKKVDAVNADFTNCVLTKSDLFGSDLEGAKLVSADLRHSNLKEVSLVGANLIAADLSYCNIKNIKTNGIIVNAFTKTKEIKIDKKTFLTLPMDFQRIIIRDNQKYKRFRN